MQDSSAIRASRRLQRVARQLRPSAAGASSPSLVSSSDVASHSAGFFDGIRKAPLDPILGTKVLYLADKDPQKMNLGIGAYRDNQGKPVVLESVRKADLQVAQNRKLNKEYLPISGYAPFAAEAQKLMFGANTSAVKDKRIASIQSLSGTGSLRVAFEFIAKFYPNASVYLSNPTWGNHKALLAAARVCQETYRYWDPRTRGLDIDGMLADIRAAPAQSVILLHACAHNPTGVDPTFDQWQLIAQAVKERNHMVLFDCAYQGFATGDLERDAAAVRYFAEQGMHFIVCQSFAKNFGLYNERVGALHVVTSSQESAQAVISQLNLVVRPMYSNPPSHGAYLVHTILTNEALRNEWFGEMKAMSERIKQMRAALLGKLRELRTPGDWTHITDQIGMFSYTGLTVAQCERMIEKHHVYMLKNGRISMSGINQNNVEYLARAIDEVVRHA